MNNIYDYLPDPYKGLESYLEDNRLFFFGREDDREEIINKLITHRLTILYGASGVGKSSVLRAGVKHYFRQAAQENADIKGKPGLGVIIFPPMEGRLKDRISWQDPISGIKEQLKVEMKILGIKEAPSENLSLTDTLKAWIELIRDNTRRSRLFIILDQFEEYFLLLSQQNGKDKAPLHKFAKEFPKAVNDLKLNVNFLIAIREDSLSKIDYFKREIPSWFKYHIEIAPLNRHQAKEAIEKPIAEYNRQKIILNSLLSSRLTVLSGDRNTHKSTLLELGIARYLREKNQGCVLFNGWCKHEDWQTGLKQQIQTDLEPLVKQNSQLGDRSIPPASDLSLVETLQKWTPITAQESENSPIFLILDQFESYFRQQSARDRDGVLIKELLKVINDDSLNVNILLSIRCGALPLLEKSLEDCSDSPKSQFLYLYKEKGIDRITKNSFDPQSSEPLIEVEIESDLANEILNDFESEQTEIKIEAPYLQLVMTRLWQEEKERIKAEKAFSLKLRTTTYTDLRLARILKEYLYKQINQLDEGYRKIAVRSLYYLVTPSGTQLLSLSANDLTEFANQNRLSDELKLEPKLVKQLLEQLSHGSSRIICPVEGDRYKVFFPILAKEVSNWVQLHHQIKYLKQEAEIASQQFKSSQLEALLTAMKVGQVLRRGINEDRSLAGDASTLKVTETLQTILQDIREKNQFKPPEGSVYSVNFSPDGKQLAIGTSDGTIQLWDLQNKKLNTLDKVDSAVYYVCFSPDGTKLAAAIGTGNIYLWVLQNNQWQINPPLNEGTSPIYFLSFSRDGQTLAAGAEDGTPYLWDLQSQQQQPLAKGEQLDNSIYYVSLNANGQMLATISGTYFLDLWQLDEDKKELKKVTGNYKELNQLKAGISSVSFSPSDPMRLAAGLADGKVYLWNLENVKATIFPSQQEQEPIAHIDFKSEGNQLATVSFKGKVCLWNLRNNQKQPQFSVETTNDILYRVNFSPDGKQLAIVQWDGRARLWNLQRQKSEEVKQEKTVSKDSAISLWVWDLLYKKEPRTLEDRLVTHISFNPNPQHGQQLAIGFQDGKVLYHLDLDRKKPPLPLPLAHKGGVYRMDFSSDGKHLATASQDGTCQVYDLENEMPISFDNINKSSVYGISFFSHDGKQLLFTGSGDGMVRLWDLGQLDKKKPIHEFRGHQGIIYYLSVSPDGQKLATASVDCTVRLWNLEGNFRDNLKDEKPSFECRGHQGPAYWVSFSPDGQQLATASGDGTVRLWNLQGKEQDGARGIHPAPVFCVNFIPGKQELVTACWDGKVRLWSLQGKLLSEFPIEQGAVLCVSPSFDGKLLATVSDLGNGKAILLERRPFDVQKEINRRIKDLDQLLNQGCEWLEDYFTTHPEVRQDFQNLKICPHDPVI